MDLRSSLYPVLFQFPLTYFDRNRELFEKPGFPVKPHLKARRFPQRMMRYWIAHEALRRHQKALGRPLDLVDLGCERGLLKMLAGQEIRAHWCGLDWNLSRPSLQSANYDELHQADFDKALPIADNFADAVVSLHVFEHIPRPEFAAAEVFRLLKPGGIFLMGVPVVPSLFAKVREKKYQQELQEGTRVAGKHINKFDVKRALTLCEQAGFRIDWWTGTHFFRLSGSRLEDSSFWVRVNQAWGWAFPSLGRELYLQVRKPE